jgi:multidrug efflux system outer membrane protein
MKKKINIIYLFVLFMSTLSGCKNSEMTVRGERNEVPENFNGFLNPQKDTVSSANVKWRDYFSDPYLVALIDTALINNQEMNIMLQEIEIARNEIRAKKGEYLPTVFGAVGAGVDKSARYTRYGALEDNIQIEPGTDFPEPLQDYVIGIHADWEIDIWHKLRNAKKAAVSRYLSTIAGKNFMVTNLVSEISNEYYELLSFDSQLKNIDQNINIQSNALNIVRQEKNAGKVTELAVRRFEAQLYSTQSLKYIIQQEIIEKENNINFLVGRFPQPVLRSGTEFNDIVPNSISQGLPSQMLDNRQDIKQAEFNLKAQKIDVKVARARFYPTVGISAGIGLQAFNPTYLIKSPESILFSLAGDLVAPLINRNAIKADYYGANAKQLQSVFEYEKTILSAYIEVTNQLSKMDNLKKSYEFKSLEVDALNKSIVISNTLFKSARADYLEVLLTQEEAIESQFELIEIKKQQLHAVVNTYKALGGGWN